MADSRRQTRGRRTSDTAPGVEQVVVETLLRGIWVLLTFPFRRRKSMSKSRGEAIPRAVAQELAAHWPSIEGHLEYEHTWGLAVSEADKLLDAAMVAAGVRGETMGERLKQAAAYFPDYLYQQVWNAHKLRNTLAHEVGFRLTREEAASALRTFKNALLQFGVLV